MSKTLSISLIIVALVLGMGLGFIISPQYSKMGMEAEHSADLGAADTKYDLRFIDSMIAHHMGAIQMANEAKQNSRRAEITNLANNIISAQEQEVSQLYSWKQEWYNDTTKVSLNNYSMAVKLGNYDTKFDLRFINAMIAHHEMAIEMAMDAQSKSSRNEILNTADVIISAQSAEIEQMQTWRSEWYNIK